MSNRVFVGVRLNAPREVFRSWDIPTFQTHGDRFAAVIGPFRTVRAARLMARHGSNNPHLHTVADAERIARQQR